MDLRGFISEPSRALDAADAAFAAQQLNPANQVWLLVASAFVLFMQVGFLLLEAGFARSKNSINVAQKNIVDFMVAGVLFSLVGFGLLFGPTVFGLIGNPLDFSPFASNSPWMQTFFVFQLMFVGTAATIVSGAVAERMRFSAYLVTTAVISTIIYPVFGHWAWGNGLLQDNHAWLADRGFIDFAGSTVVHSTGGWIALACLILLGPRVGRFSADGKVNAMSQHSIVLSGAGALILLVGWMGFNGGSALAATPGIGSIIANTLIAAVFGGTAGLVLGRLLDGIYAPVRTINGMLGALVGVTAGCASVDLAGAAAIGTIAALVVVLAEDVLLKRFRIDDVVGAVAVHGVGGVVGTLLVAVFALPEHLAAGSRLAQFGVQALGVVTAFVWAFGVGYLVLKAFDMMVGLRISVEDERRGLNAAEHGASLGTGALQEALMRMRTAETSVARMLDENTVDESAELASIINPMIADLEGLVESVSEELETSDHELRVAMRQLQAARDEAQAANVAKSQFIANMSHELRTPLNAIIGYSEILLEEAQEPGSASAEAEADLLRILSAARHLLAIIGEILDISKLEAGRVTLDIEPFEAASVIRDVVTMVAPAAATNGNTIEIVGAEEAGIVNSDQAKVRQCLLNLVSNANKFTSNGPITISCAVSDCANEPMLTVAVRDTGIGIAAQKLPDLFAPFVQADASVTRRFGGTGLGLAITRQLARALGGDVAVKSVEGVGSTFTLTLPVMSQAAGLPKQQAA